MLQIQMAVIYFSAAILKFQGDAWFEGTAMYYVSRLDDYFATAALATGNGAGRKKSISDTKASPGLDNKLNESGGIEKLQF